MFQNSRFNFHTARNIFSETGYFNSVLLIFTISIFMFNTSAQAYHGHNFPRFCSDTAKLKYVSCRFENKEDYFSNLAKCINETGRTERADCYSESRDKFYEERQLCRDRLSFRRDFCSEIGENRYDPDFSPENFVDPRDIGTSVAVNPYFPLVPGSRRVYEGGDEIVVVTFTDKVKLIAGVKCLVVRDVVTDDGDLVEDTQDWYAQDKQGNVWYCGEEVKDYEINEGDEPQEPELIAIDGSFKVGVERAKPGILMMANPVVGESYRQEFALGEAEDAAKVISITASETTPATSCNTNCLITRDINLMEPGPFEFKYYAPGVGLMLEIDDEGNRLELVEIN